MLLRLWVWCHSSHGSPHTWEHRLCSYLESICHGVYCGCGSGIVWGEVEVYAQMCEFPAGWHSFFVDFPDFSCLEVLHLSLCDAKGTYAGVQWMYFQPVPVGKEFISSFQTGSSFQFPTRLWVQCHLHRPLYQCRILCGCPVCLF